jgi:hypothetical protein
MHAYVYTDALALPLTHLIPKHLGVGSVANDDSSDCVAADIIVVDHAEPRAVCEDAGRFAACRKFSRT